MNTYNPHFHRSLRTDRVETQRPQDGLRIGVRTLSSSSLFERGEHEIGIAHGESLYRLKITRQGKLILNK
jgi:hemin uptake protein HemP